jgi:hypothetical protein
MRNNVSEPLDSACAVRVPLMEAAFPKQGFVNVMAALTFSDSTIRAFDSRLPFIWARAIG